MFRLRRRAPARHPLVWLAIGLLFTVVGLVFGVVAPRATGQEITRVERLPPFAVGDLREQPVGAEVLVEGRVSDRMPAAFRSYVAYAREEYRGRERTGNRGQRWVEDERVTPPLVVELSSGQVQIANDDYHFGNTPVSWQESKVLTWNSAINEGTKRYRGLERGGDVVVIGTLVGDDSGAIAAEVVASGTRADYIAAARRSATIFTALGGALGLVGGLILAGTGWWLVRLRGRGRV